MWLYIIGGVVLAAVVFVLYLMYKGYSKVKPKPLPGMFRLILSLLFYVLSKHIIVKE